jgi:hypothetical protein
MCSLTSSRSLFNYLGITLRSEDAALAVCEPRYDVLHEYALVCACLELTDELVRKVG